MNTPWGQHVVQSFEALVRLDFRTDGDESVVLVGVGDEQFDVRVEGERDVALVGGGEQRVSQFGEVRVLQFLAAAERVEHGDVAQCRHAVLLLHVIAEACAHLEDLASGLLLDGECRIAVEQTRDRRR